MLQESGVPGGEEPLTGVPRRDRRFVLLALVVVIAIVLGLRRVRSQPVVSDVAPPETES